MKITPRQEELLKRTFLDFKQMSEFIREPLILERAQGLYYWDIEGKRYYMPGEVCDPIGKDWFYVEGDVPRPDAELTEQLQSCKEGALLDHLQSYIRKTENLVQVNTRAGEKPVVYPISKGVVRNSALTFAVLLMVAMFAAVLREHQRERRRQAPADFKPGVAD